MAQLIQFQRLQFFIALFIVVLISQSRSSSDTLVSPGSFPISSVEKSTYIIHMDKSAMPKIFNSHHHWYSATVNSLKSETWSTSFSSSDSSSILYTYDHALHGFSAMLSEYELENLKKLPGFLSAAKDKVVIHHTTHTTDFLSLNPSSGLWPTSGFGNDVIIGIVDSGYWPESQSFKDDGMGKVPGRWKGGCESGEEFNSSMCNKKVIGARYFNKALIAKNPGQKVTMNSPRDIDGHGTHTASTAAGNYVDNVSFFGYAKGTAKGVAPRARLAIYKVTWLEGAYTSDVIAGMDQAVADGVDILSVSLGFYGVDPFYENPLAIASFGAMEKGVLVALSAGNDGPTPKTLHNDIPWPLTVGASTVDRTFTGTLTLGNGLIITGWTMFPASALLENSTLYYEKTLALCDDPVLLSRSPYAIIICEDTGKVLEQLEHVTRSNSIGAIFISEDPVLFEKGGVPWPAVVISRKEGNSVIKYAKASKEPTASIKFQETIIGKKPAPSVALYSSRGPSKNYPGILKPDLMAPGSLVLAAFVPGQTSAMIGFQISLSSEYTMMSGTSMSCPHAAGVAAMLRGSHPDWSPAVIRSAMMTTANNLDNTNSPIKDFGNNMKIASPLDMGSGQIDPNRALDPGLVYDIAPEEYVKLLCFMNYTKQQISTITRRSIGQLDCSKKSGDINYPSFAAVQSNDSKISVQTFKRTVMNVGNGAAEYRANITMPNGSKVTVSPGILNFSKKYEKQSYNLTIRGKINSNKNETKVAFGWLSWIEEHGRYVVRSPIVILPL
ncbi:serine protease [Lithospermum erythrorhizon]|uniref:Serine protease n=1 Tax=Lithospermum erythrorhizon TaxID=34254 RepID=A0AAV3R6C6_LITER